MLTAGQKIGIYEIVSSLGAGGMGEVYRARDTKLQRDVALKVLPDAMARDAQRMARFEREAQVLASLNHPNIAAIHGLEESNGIRALVMELVEGETLAERLGRAKPVTPYSSSKSSGSGGTESGEGSPGSSLATDVALSIAKQIAEALEYAHERGVIHRDLKPANVKITPEGTVKVLDFGLAKVLDSQDSTATMDITNSPTLSAMATQAGVILGTAAYMSPEQAKGQRVDRRADIWAFGCVLFEMLTGGKPFEGETISDVLAAVIRAEPEWTEIPETTPPPIQRLVRRCLQKDRRQRLQAIGEARITIEETISGTGVSPVELHGQDAHATTGVPGSLLRSALPWGLAGILAVVAAILAIGYIARTPQPQHVIRFSISAPENTNYSPTFGSLVSLSPDGREVAFRALSGSGTSELWVRPLDSLTARRVPGTEGAGMFFWSPDGQYIAFFASGKLQKVALSGGAPQTLCDVQGHPTGTWSRDGVILFVNADGSGLYRVPATGGTPTLVLAPDKKGGQYLFPQFLPDGRHFIFVQNGAAKLSIDAGALGSKKITRLMETESNALYAPPGELLYLSANTLMARPFDAKSLRFTGAAVPVAENVGELIGVLGCFSISPSGVLAYQSGVSSAQDQMVWFNREGKELGTLGPPGNFRDPMISPDGTKIATEVGELGKNDIWVYDLKRGTGSRLTFNPANDVNPVWSPDGKQILFSSNRKGAPDIYEKASNGLGSTQLAYASQQTNYLIDVTPDGRYALYETGSGMWVLPLGGDHKPFAFVQGKYHPGSGQFSPNGRYLAYASGETGRNEIYVQTFPQQAGKWEISTDGGVDPVWGHDGKELYYLDPKNELMAVRVNTSSSAFQAGTPKLLFQTHSALPTFRGNYVVSPDGKRFLMLVPAEKSAPSPITVVVNWPALLKK